MTRPLRILSIALLTAGLVLLADIGATLLYREPLSSLYAAVKQHEAASQLDDLEARFRGDAGGAAPDRGRRLGALTRRLGSQVGPGDAIGRIRSPAMGDLDAVVVHGTDTASLEQGPGHYPQTSFPGQGGTVAIAGHRTTYGAPFRHVDSLRRGDEIVLEMPYGTFRYQVRRTAIVDPEDVGVIRDVGSERLVLSSCNPLYSASERFIVFARPAGAEPAR